MNILCTGNSNKSNYFDLFNEILNEFSSQHNIYLDKFISVNNVNEYKRKSIYNNNVDIVLSLGGDGSILSAVTRMKDKQVPILGIHIGELGFLNQATLNNYKECIRYLLDGNKITYQNNFLLKAKIIKDDKQLYKFYAINDFAINQIRYSRLLKINVCINNDLLNQYNCDGLIVATPLGSTAYSLSAGGPIVSKDVDSIIITPVSPHSLSARPIVISSNSLIEISFPNLNNKIGIYADGQTYKSLDKSMKIVVSKSKRYAKLINIPFVETYYYKLRNKLKWFSEHED